MPKVRRTPLQKWTLLVLFVLAAYGFWRTMEPIWVPLLLGLVIAVGIYPLHEKLLRKLGGKHPGLSAALLTTLVMTLALGIIAFLLFVVGHRVVILAQEMATRYGNKGAAGVLGTDLSNLLGRLGLSADDLQQRFVAAMRDLAAYLGKGATSIVAGLFSVIFIFIFTALTSYYLLREGNEGTSWLVQMLPLPNGQVAQLVHDVRDVMRAVLLSTVALAIYQGVTAGIGYWIFGVDSPLVWASLTGVASILPAVGTALVWAPVGVVVMLTGHIGAGLGVLAWGGVVVVFIADYVLRPKLVGTKIKMNDLLVFIAIFGGIEAFGVLGIILGPIAVAVLLSLLRIYEHDYRPEGPVETPKSAKQDETNGDEEHEAPAEHGAH